jgi:hypothetical protein
MARRLILVTAVALALLNWTIPAALAAERMPDGVTMAVHVDFPTGGLWSSSGALVDEGTVVPLSQRFGSLFAPSPQWTAHEEILFTGQAGSFTMQQQALLIDVNPNLSVGTTHWVIVSGTGAYAELHGRGTGAVTIRWDAGTLDVTVVGKIHFPAP